MLDASPASFDQGWYSCAIQRPSPFFNERPADETGQVSLLVIHNISLPEGEFGHDYIDQLFLGNIKGNERPEFESLIGLEVSSHFLIRRDGQLIQYVSCEHRAWHAGVSTWNNRENCNDFSIGIEMEGSDDQDFECIQYQVLASLTDQLKQHYAIEAIVGHSDIAPGRKTDPGACFDWDHYLTLLDQCSECKD